MAGVMAAILAGGLGTRLRSVVKDRPKVLAEIHGRPFMAYLLDQLSTNGLKTVVLCTGYLGEQIRCEFGNSYGSMDLVYSQEAAPLGTGGALRLALPLFQADPILVMNGDSFCQMDLRAFWDWHRSVRGEASLALVKIANSTRYGQVRVDADGTVLSFVEKASRGDPCWVNAGIYLVTRDLIGNVPENRPISLEREIFPAWVGKGLYGYRSDGRFLDIGTPEAYAEAGRFFMPEVVGTDRIDKTGC